MSTITGIQETALCVSQLVIEKNAAYGNSVGQSAELLKLLYPNGLRPDQYLDAIFAARDFDKRSRLAQLGPDAHGEDPRLDLAGYAVLALHFSEQGKDSAPCTGSANDPAVAKQHQVPADSAAPPTSERTTTSANERTASDSSQPSTRLSKSESANKAVGARIVMVDAPQSAPGRARVPLVRCLWLNRNSKGRCAFCYRVLPEESLRFSKVIGYYTVQFDSQACCDAAQPIHGVTI